MATNARADARYPLPQAVLRSPFFRELESMIGRSALRVAKQHGHSIATMLRVYAAWTEGAIEANLDAIERAMAAAAHDHASGGHAEFDAESWRVRAPALMGHGPLQRIVRRHH